MDLFRRCLPGGIDGRSCCRAITCRNDFGHRERYFGRFRTRPLFLDASAEIHPIALQLYAPPQAQRHVATLIQAAALHALVLSPEFAGQVGSFLAGGDEVGTARALQVGELLGAASEKKAVRRLSLAYGGPPWPRQIVGQKRHRIASVMLCSNLREPIKAELIVPRIT
jgi:hypothetical protein